MPKITVQIEMEHSSVSAVKEVDDATATKVFSLINPYRRVRRKKTVQ